MDTLDHHKRQVTRFYDETWNRPDTLVNPGHPRTIRHVPWLSWPVKNGHAAFADYVEA